MNKKLPINLLPEIRYECWMYQRMAIIRAYPEFDAWFVHHLNSLYIISEYDCDFGRFGEKYNIVGDYEDIKKKEYAVTLQPRDVLHIPGLGFDGLVGYSPIAMAKNAIVTLHTTFHKQQ